MNILLWILQAALAFLYLSGGAFKALRSAELAGQWRELPAGAWRVLGIMEVVGGVLLLLPPLLGWVPRLTALAAAVLALETLVLAALYARRSLALKATNPLLWALPMGLLAAFVAYGRYALAPFA